MKQSETFGEQEKKINIYMYMVFSLHLTSDFYKSAGC